jgi:hypothetical protein
MTNFDIISLILGVTIIVCSAGIFIYLANPISYNYQEKSKSKSIVLGYALSKDAVYLEPTPDILIKRLIKQAVHPLDAIVYEHYTDKNVRVADISKFYYKRALTASEDKEAIIQREAFEILRGNVVFPFGEGISGFRIFGTGICIRPEFEYSEEERRWEKDFERRITVWNESAIVLTDAQKRKHSYAIQKAQGPLPSSYCQQ